MLLNDCFPRDIGITDNLIVQMPHVRKQEYKVPSKEYELEYVEVIQRHHKVKCSRLFALGSIFGLIYGDRERLMLQTHFSKRISL